MQNGQLVSDLKACISEKANAVAVNRLKLVYKGRTMQDTTLIDDYNLEEGSKVHLILQKDSTVSQSADQKSSQPQSRFEIILRDRLAQHFPLATVEKIMANLQHEINEDINSSSLDDLERLAKQKLKISNE